MNILERMRAGELIFDTDPEYPSLYAEFEKTMKLVAQLNSGYHTPEEIRDLLGRIWGHHWTNRYVCFRRSIPTSVSLPVSAGVCS